MRALITFSQTDLPALASEALNGLLRRSRKAKFKLFWSRIKIHAVWTSWCLSGWPVF